MGYFDRADWHYLGNYPQDLPRENGATHIGMFLAWAIQRGLDNESARKRNLAALELVRQREMTGAEFLLKRCDEKFGKFVLNDEGNAFTEAYYEAQYADDYERILRGDLPTIYHVQNSWENFDKIAEVIDRRYEDWRASRGSG